jgi:hypothetical protein
LGNFPVKYVACTEQVTAGKTGFTAATFPSDAHFDKNGICSSKLEVNPTTLRTTVFCIKGDW